MSLINFAIMQGEGFLQLLFRRIESPVDEGSAQMWAVGLRVTSMESRERRNVSMITVFFD